MKIFGVVYKITNLITSKVYIGQTTQSASSRFYGHCEDAEKGSTTKLHEAMRTFGYQNFEIEVLHRAYTRDELNRHEIVAIADYNSVADGYNMTIGGSGEKPDISSAKITDVLVSPEQVKEILTLVDLGDSAEDIARELYLRPSLVKIVLDASQTPNTPIWRDILTYGLVTPDEEMYEHYEDDEYEEEEEATPYEEETN